MFVSKMLFLLGGVVPATGICTIVYSSSQVAEVSEGKTENGTASESTTSETNGEKGTETQGSEAKTASSTGDNY